MSDQLNQLRNSFAEKWAKEEEKLRFQCQQWDNIEIGYAGECPHCGRQRLMKCRNGKHRCEKCEWCPEIEGYVVL